MLSDEEEESGSSQDGSGGLPDIPRYLPMRRSPVLTPPPVSPPNSPTTSSPRNSSCSVKELKEKLKGEGLPVSGRKEILLQRLKDKPSKSLKLKGERITQSTMNTVVFMNHLNYFARTIISKVLI